MLVLCLALVLSGGSVYLIGGTASRSAARVVFHVGVAAGLGLLLALVGLVVAGLTPWLTGMWFTMLAGVYAGHVFAVRNWGAPMNQPVFLFALRNCTQFARANPRLTLTGCPALAVLFSVGWAAAWFDTLTMGGLQGTIYLAGACILLGFAAFARCTTQVSAGSDLLLGLVLGGAGAMAGPPPDDPSLGKRRLRPAVAARHGTVIVFVVDSLRPRNMSAFGYERPTTPFLTELLARRGARAVPLAITNGGSTTDGYWTIFSSRRTRHHAANAPCLHDVLRSAGFSTRFFLSGSHHDWMGMEYLYGTDHQGFVDCLIDEQLPVEAMKLPANQADRGDLLFFHLMSTHQESGCAPPEVWKPAQNRAAWGEADRLDAAAREQIVNHYDNSVLQADDCIARIMDVLKDKGYLEDALVVVTGDHGEALGERDPVTIGHGRDLYQESVQVPLIVWDSTQELPEPAFLADQTDIAPTVVGLLGIEPPLTWQGTSIFETPGRRSVHVENVTHFLGKPPTHMEALLALLPSGLFKVMQHRQGGRLILSQAYCLTADPREDEELTGRLSPELESQLETVWRDYHDEPARTRSERWSFIRSRGDGTPRGGRSSGASKRGTTRAAQAGQSRTPS